MDKQLDLKNKLKEWERAFFNINGRKPAKGDVDIAPAEIRNFYIDFWNLKKRTSTDSGYSSCSNDKRNGSNFRLKREGSFSDKLLPRRPSSLPQSTVIQKQEDSYPTVSPLENVENVTVEMSKDEKREKLRLVLESMRKDETFLMKPFADVKTNFQNSFSNRNVSASSMTSSPVIDVDENSDGNLPDEIDFRKRQNLCKFSFEYDQQFEDESNVENSFVDQSSINEEPNYDEFECVSNDISNQIQIGEIKKRKRRKINTNFVKLDLKHKNYASRTGRKLKGAALKRLLLKKKFKKMKK